MKKIIFVCTGNTCRSPMAEILLRDKLKKNNIKIEVISRGISVFLPSNANDNAVAVMKEYNLDLTGHKSKQILQEDIDEETLILTMTIQHKQYLSRVYPAIKSKIYSLNEYINEKGDIKDPFNGDINMYRTCAESINKSIEKLVNCIY